MRSARTVVVSGAPGTGKSTLASALAERLQLPLLSLDHIKEALADVLGLGGELWSDRMGDAAAEVVFRLANSFPGVVAEGWWRRERRVRAVREVQPLHLGGELIEVDTTGAFDLDDLVARVGLAVGRA